jgi:Do/DeqQ family serine protease
MDMENRAGSIRNRATQAVLAVVATVALGAGAAWYGLASPMASAASEQVTSAPVAQAIGGQRASYADIVDAVTPAVVTIRVEGRARVTPTAMQDDDFFRRFFGDQFGQQFGTPRRGPAPRTQGLGSGVIVSRDGYILTNHHVIDGAENIRVDFNDGRTLTGKVIGSDQPSDLAVVKVEGTNLRTLPLGDSDAVRVGDVVLAIGNPLGVGQTVTMGIVSAKGRSTGVGDGSYEDFLQTDAPINQGNSGGALVNLRGELIGINSQILSPSQGNIGIGFAIPANMARHVMDELRSGGTVRRAQLGVTVQPVTSDLAESLGLKDVRGAIVSSVEPGSAADHAGVRRGDVITAFNGQEVRDSNALRNRVADAKPGSSSAITVIRDGREQTLNVTLDEAASSRSARNGTDPGMANGEALGVSVAPLTPDMASRAGVPRDTRGLMVQDVDPDGRAASAGIRPGDVIVEVNQKPVGSVADLRSAVRGASDRPLLLLVNREGRDLFVTVRPS